MDHCQRYGYGWRINCSRALENGHVRFAGELSLENNGGFTSMRGPLRTDLTDYTGIRMQVLGDGRTYFLRLRDTGGYDGIAHEQPFETVAGEWIVVEIPFSDLVPVFRGFQVDRPSLARDNLQAIGIMLREKTPGPFALEIDWIEAY